MPENELRPKGKTSKEWIDYADEKLDQFKKYHSKRTLSSANQGPTNSRSLLGMTIRVSCLRRRCTLAQKA